MKRIISSFFLLLILVLAAVFIWRGFKIFLNTYERTTDSLFKKPVCVCDCKSPEVEKKTAPAPLPPAKYAPTPSATSTPTSTPAQPPIGPKNPNGPSLYNPEPIPKPTPSYEVRNYSESPVYGGQDALIGPRNPN